MSKFELLKFNEQRLLRTYIAMGFVLYDKIQNLPHGE